MLLLYEFIKAAILGAIQGITEWLPISSTGHMILADEFINLAGSGKFVNSFTVVIQLGSVLAVIILFGSKLNPINYKNKTAKPETIELWKKILVASIPAAILGLMFDDFIDTYLYRSEVVAITLIIYGVLFLFLENRPLKPTINSIDRIDYQTALKIGMFQVLALVPGTSRSGATIFGGLLQKIDRSVIAEFSFYMSIPVLIGASGLKLIKNGLNFNPEQWLILAIGCITAFVVSIIAIKSFLKYIKTHNFKVFGYYRIVIGFIILIYFILNK